MGAALAMAYGLVVYAFFFATFLYTIGFIGGVFVPKSIDMGTQVPLAEALLVNVGLLLLFGVQHSVMARRGFKQWWTRIVPPSVERATFVLATTVVLALLDWQWRPITQPLLWRVEGELASLAIWLVFWLGWVVLLVSTFLITHFGLFGLRQVFARLRGRQIPEPEFRTPFFYRYVRHPIYLGFVL